MDIAVILVIFGCIFSLAMASWIPSTKLEVTKQNDTDEVGTATGCFKTKLLKSMGCVTERVYFLIACC